MNRKDFENLPALLRRSQVVDCGIPENAIESLRHTLRNGGEGVPDGMIGAMQLPGRNCRKNRKNAKWKYRKSDVAKLCGF